MIDTHEQLNVLNLQLPLRILGSGTCLPGEDPVSHYALLKSHPAYALKDDHSILKLSKKTQSKFGLEHRHMVHRGDVCDVSLLENDILQKSNEIKNSTSESLSITATQQALNGNRNTAVQSLIHGTTTTSRYTGSQAPAILDAIHSNAPGIEIKAGCSTSLVALHSAYAYLSMGYQNTMISCAETLSKTINPEQLETLFLLADGAASIWLEHGKHAPQFIVRKSLYHTDGNYIDTYTTPGTLPPNQHDLENNNYTMKGNGQTLRQQAKKRYQQMLDTLFPEGDGLQSISWIVPHQINRGLIDELIDKNNLNVNIQWDAEQVGNLGGTSVMYSLVRLIESGQLKKGDQILLMSVGGGLSFAMQHWEWLEE